MHRLTCLFRMAAVAAGLLTRSSYADIPDWETVRGSLAPPNSYEVGGVVSDGYGQHVVTTSNHAGTQGPQTDVTYYLFGNNGETIRSSVFTETAQRSSKSTITKYGSTISIVYQDYPSGVTYIRIVQSTDGGENWSSISSTQSPVEADYLDAYADQNGTHIVFSNPSEVYYIRYRPYPFLWTDQQNITSIGYPFGERGYGAKVVANGNAIVVSYIAYANSGGSSPTSVASRDGELTSNGIDWENSVRDATLSGFNASTQSLARRGNEMHLMIARGTQSPQAIRTSVRSGSGNWSEPTFFDYAGEDEFQNHKRKLILFGDTLLTCYSISASVWFSQNATTNWSTSFEVDEQSPPISLRRSTLSASRTGTYVFWNRGQAASLWMRRKPYALSGSINENMYWTDNNWVSDDLNIESGYTVTAKSGSVTTVLAGKKIVVNEGATLIAEPGAEFLFESGASLEVQGTLTVSGASNDRVIFDQSGSSGWDGIVIANDGSGPNADIEYASILHATTGIRASHNVTLSLSEAIIDEATVGIELAYISGSEGTNAKVISNCILSNIGEYGVIIDNMSTVSLEGTMISGGSSPKSGLLLTDASPTILGCIVTDFPEGLECAGTSSPELENGAVGGHNVFTRNEIGVNCLDNSSPILGYMVRGVEDEGGQNSIFENSTYDVVVVANLYVSAHNNWWGSASEPFNFSIGSGATLEYDPWLTTDPNPLLRPTRGSTAQAFRGEHITLLGDDPLEGNISEAFQLALKLRTEGNYGAAIVTLKNIISDGEVEPLEKRWALQQLVAVAQRGKGSALSTYLRGLVNSQSALTRDIKRILPVSALLDGDVTEVMRLYNYNLQHYPGTDVGKEALYGKFSFLLAQGDFANAEAALVLLESGYESSTQARLARVRWNLRGTSQSRPSSPASLSKRETNLVPDAFALYQNYPNPFNPSTEIKFDLPDAANISLIVYDVLGREVAVLVDDHLEAGYHRVTLNAANLASGLYFYRLNAGRYMETRKLMLLK